MFTYGERKKAQPTFTEFSAKICRFLPLQAASIAILKIMKLTQCNAIGVRTPPDSDCVALW